VPAADDERDTNATANRAMHAGYYVIDSDDGTVTSITFGEAAQAVDASAQEAEAWVVESAAHLVAGHPNVTTGEVRVQAER